MPVAKRPRQYASAPLAAGTRVRHRARGELGTVQHYDPRWSKGIFPVRWDRTRIWESCLAHDVVVVPETPGADLR